MMLCKNRKKRVGLSVVVLTSCLVLAVLWTALATPGTALAKKPTNPGKPGDDEPTYYDVEMTGDLTLIGSFNYEPSDGWAVSAEDRIRVNRPRPKICITNEFLATGGASLDGEICPHGDGVIPDGDGAPNWGALVVIDDPEGMYVKYYIGETDADTGKINRYDLTTEGPVELVTTGSGTWPYGDGDDVTVHTVTVRAGTQWSLVQAKPGNLETTLKSTQPTVITFTEYTGP